MKKFLSFFAVALVVAASAMVITSCGDDEPKQKAKATTSLELTFNEELLSVADFSVVYTDEYGQTSTEKVTTTSYSSKVYTITKLPAEGNFKIIATPKSSYPQKDKYSLKMSYKFNYNNSSKGEDIINTNLAADKLEEYITRRYNCTFTWKFDANGNIDK